MSIDYLNGCCSVNRNGYSVYDFNHNTVQQLLCEFFTKINECVYSSNKALEFMEWIKEEGLPLEVVKYIKQILEDGTLADLINKTIFEDLNSQLDNIGIDLDVRFPRLNGETNDYFRVERAINAIPEGSTLILPNTELEFDNNKLFVYRTNIKIKGQSKPVFDLITRTMKKGTIIKNGTIQIEAKGTTVECIGVYLNDNSTMVDGIATGNNAYDVTIYNCCLKAKDHCFISQGIDTSKINVKNCEAYDTTHGFVSKVPDLIFENCYSEKCGTNGFVFVSDNIGNATRIFTCKYNKAINCTANGCGSSFTTYSRDMYSGHNVNGVLLSDLLLENCTSINAKWQGYSIGDNKADETTVTYVPVENITLRNIVEKNTTPNFSVVFAKCKNVIVDGISQESKPFNVETYSSNVQLLNVLNGQKLPATNLLPIGDDNPNINGAGIYFTNNDSVSTVDYKYFENAKKGDIITIIFKDDKSMIQRNISKIELSRDFYLGKGCILILENTGNKWVEIYGHQVPKKSGINTSLDITTKTSVDLIKSNIINVTGSGVTTNKITVTNFNRNSDILTFLIMPTYGSSLTYGGFDTSLFTEPTNIKKSLSSGVGQVLQFVFEPVIFKYVCINVQDVKQI